MNYTTYIIGNIIFIGLLYYIVKDNIKWWALKYEKTINATNTIGICNHGI